MRSKWATRAATAAFLTGLGGVCVATEKALDGVIRPLVANSENKPKPGPGSSSDSEWRMAYVFPYKVPKAGLKTQPVKPAKKSEPTMRCSPKFGRT